MEGAEEEEEEEGVGLLHLHLHLCWAYMAQEEVGNPRSAVG